MDHVMTLLFDKEFLITAFVGILAFATVVTLGVPYLERGGLDDRLKTVARRREELRAKHHASLNAKKASLRVEPVSYMKATLDRFKLGNMLESENTKEKLASAGYRGQAPLIAFMFFRFVMPFILFAVTLFYMFLILHLSWPPIQKIGAAFVGALLAAGFHVVDEHVGGIKAQQSANSSASSADCEPISDATRVKALSIDMPDSTQISIRSSASGKARMIDCWRRAFMLLTNMSGA